ncbi:MAG: DUF5658 family protein [Acidobacteria bacterium]|nr:DUF5658 family protein [Acidobacteriota bacterium]MCI0720292.1 DUF5658 family protein [Acidobacteriota bacterium]
MTRRKLLGNIAVTCFIIVQLADWVATYHGLIRFGTEIEANPLLRFLMERYDIIFALTSAKVTATIAGLFLHLFNRHLEVASLTLIYTWLALIPWSRTLSLQQAF